MSEDLLVFSTIAAMALVTYLTRIAGFLMAARLDRMPPKARLFLDHIPGTILIAIIAPQIVAGGWLTGSAALVCLAMARLTQNLMAVMLSGVVYVSLIRYLSQMMP